MNVVKSSGTPFYLTGGTALSRHYLNHRYSDDIDLFVNDDPRFEEYTATLLMAMKKYATVGGYSIINKMSIISKNYAQFRIASVRYPDVELKIDLVNDVAPHFGGFEDNQRLGKIDSWRNIISNKISALFRFEPKDYVDIRDISLHYGFSWDEIIAEAREKETGLDAAQVSEVIQTIPFELLKTIKWIREPDYSAMSSDFTRIAMDILRGGSNSLFQV